MQQLISDLPSFALPIHTKSAYICSNTGVHDLRGLCGSRISFIMIKDKGTLAPPLIRQTVRQPWQPQKGRQIAIKNKSPLTEEKPLQRKNHGPQANVTMAATGDANRPRRLAGSGPSHTRSWCHHLRARNSQQNYTQDSQTAAGWRANLIGPVRISKPSPRFVLHIHRPTHSLGD